MPTAIICIVLVVICIIGIRSYCKKLKSGCCGAGGDEVKRVKPADKDITNYAYTYQIKIEGMTCRNCAMRIENMFNEQEGFYAKVNLKKKLAEVHSKQEVPQGDLKRMVLQIGYQPVSIDTVIAR